MTRVQFINHEGKKILFLNFAECDRDAIPPVITEAKRVINGQPPLSLLTLTDVTNAKFDETISQQFKEFATHNKPYVRAAAVVGITGFRRIIFEAVMLFSQRKLHAFDSISEAKSWLSKVP